MMKFLSLIGFVFVVVLAQAEDTDVEQPERRAESCTQSAQLDLQLIVDSSGSVGEQHFHEMMKDIAEKVLSSFVIGTKNTRVALFKYSHKLVNEFDLDKFADMKSLKAATAAVKFEKGGTMTGKAMKEALGHFTKKMRKDAKTAKVCIVFTDGLSQDAHIIPGVTKEWAKAGITVFAVGIGKGISKEGLDAIAGDVKHALQVNDFSELAKFAKKLLIEVCKTILNEILLQVQAGSGEDVWAAVNGIQDWAAKTKDKNIQITFSKNGVNVADDIFDGSGSSSTNWFTKARLMKVITGPDLTQAGPEGSGSGRFFSVRGHLHSTVERVFFVNNFYGGCPKDSGWLVVLNRLDACQSQNIWFPGVAKQFPLMAIAKGSGPKLHKDSSDWIFADKMTIKAVGNIKKIAFVGGKAGGSSQHSEPHGYRCAFQAQKQPGQCQYPFANVANQFPAIVFYQFPKLVRASKLAFSSRTDCCLSQSPSKFDIIASNDAECTAASKWVTLKEVRGVSWAKLNEEKSWDFVNNVAYRCWGIKCLKGSDGYCAIQNLKMETSAVAFVGGKAGGSSQHSEPHGYRCAFQAQKQPGQCLWPWANLAKQFPAIVFYQFPKLVYASKLAFSSRTDCCLTQSPSKFDIIASNDAKCTAASKWVTLKKVRGVSWAKLNEEKSWDFVNNVAYRCWGIKCLKGSDGYCAIQNLKMD